MRRAPYPRPSPPTRSRSRYRLEAGIVGRLREERRQQIASAPTMLEERDGRTWLVRRLPPGPAVTD
jgi:hypothetical protein